MTLVCYFFISKENRVRGLPRWLRTGTVRRKCFHPDYTIPDRKISVLFSIHFSIIPPCFLHKSFISNTCVLGGTGACLRENRPAYVGRKRKTSEKKSNSGNMMSPLSLLWYLFVGCAVAVSVTVKSMLFHVLFQCIIIGCGMTAVAVIVSHFLLLAKV